MNCILCGVRVTNTETFCSSCRGDHPASSKDLLQLENEQLKKKVKKLTEENDELKRKLEKGSVSKRDYLWTGSGYLEF